MSRPKDIALTALPGFEDTITPCRPCEADLSDAKRYTGEVLFREHPDVFKAVAASFFIDGLSVRATAARYRVSVNTVRAIRDMALGSASSDAERAVLFIKSKADRLKGIISNRALEVIYDRLENPETAAEVSVDTLLRIAELNSQSSEEKSSIPASAEIIDLDEFDDMVNGLVGEKNSAAPAAAESAGEKGESAGEKGEECSTGNSSNGVGSFRLSDTTPEALE